MVAPDNKQQRLLTLFERLLPLVDSVSDKVRFAALLGVGLDVWIFIWLFFLKGWSLTGALIVIGVVALPLLILLRFWWALEELKDLPKVAGRMLTDAQYEIQETVKGIRAGQVQKLSVFGSAKSLWSIGSLVSEARELLGSYISIGTLINPLSLLLGVLSLLFVFLLVVVSLVLLILAFF